MTITPRFTLHQTDTHVTLNIRVPHVRVSAESIETVLTDDDRVLHFSSPPYLLVLQFAPYQFHSTAVEACATYQPLAEDGTIQLSLLKAQAGVVWENLDLLGQWHKPSRRTTGVRWLQQVVVADDDDNNNVQDGDATTNQVDDDDVSPESDHHDTTDTEVRREENGYGFLRLYQGIYADLTRDGLAQEMLELPWRNEDDDPLLPSVVLPTTTTTTTTNDNAHSRRRRERLDMELAKFNPNRYRQDLDLADDYIYQCAMSYVPHWTQQQPKRSSSGSSDPDTLLTEELSQLSLQSPQNVAFFTDDEQQQLMAIPYPLLPTTITDQHAQRLSAGLVDLLFAYVYDHLTTCGDPTVESAWTISILSASLSCLDDWLDINDPTISSGNDNDGKSLVMSVGYSCLRRCLVYPYLRNFALGVHCLDQVRHIISQGVRCVLRCFLQTRAILDHSELYYLGNKLWMDPYLAWLQRDTKRVEMMLHQQAQYWWPSGWSQGHHLLADMNLLELETQYTSDVSSSAADDNEEEESDESDSSSDDDSSSSSSQNGDVGNDVEKEEDKSKSDPKDKIASDLLDESLGQTILHVSDVKSCTVLPYGKPRHPLIEEVE
eukprot:scaffold3823_cov195-Amphora_coffeaeformis.AAC.29